MVFHKDKGGNWLPILPPGNPNMPRAKPSVSVMDLQKTNRQDLPGSGLTIGNAVTPHSKLEVNKKQRGPSLGGLSGGVAANKIVVNEAGVMPLPNAIQSVEGRALLGKDDDSNIVEHEYGAKEIQDDENPNGQVTQGLE